MELFDGGKEEDMESVPVGKELARSGLVSGMC